MKNLLILVLTFAFTSALGQGKESGKTTTAGLNVIGANWLGPKEISSSEVKLLYLIRYCEEFKCVKTKVADLRKEQLSYLDSADITFHNGRISVKIYAQNNEYLSKNTYGFNPRDRGPFSFNIKTENALKEIILPEPVFNARKFNYKLTFKERVKGYKEPTDRIIFKQLVH